MYTSEYPIFAVTVDVVALTLRAGRLCVLLVRRGEEPYAGRWALPGGFVGEREDLADAALRELGEETGVRPGEGLEQLATYGGPDRDPRGRTISVAHLAVIPWAPDAHAGTDAAEASWWPLDEVEPAGGGPAGSGPSLAFDHAQILADGVERARAKLEYTALATRFLPDEFTISELRGVYDVIWGAELDPGNFHRKVSGAEGFVVETGGRRHDAPGRPARTYRAGPATTLQPPLTRRSVG